MTRLFIIGLSIYCIVIALSIACARAEPLRDRVDELETSIMDLEARVTDLEDGYYPPTAANLRDQAIARKLRALMNNPEELKRQYGNSAPLVYIGPK